MADATAPVRTEPPTVEEVVDLIARIDRLHERLMRSQARDERWDRERAEREAGR